MSDNTSLPKTWYAASTPPAPARPSLTEDIDCDVCVIGAGFTGLSTALHLAEHGLSVAVVESRQVGYGASGRNGGQIVSGYSADMDDLAARLGQEEACRLWQLYEDSKALLADRVARHQIACDLTWGYLWAANKPRHMKGLRAMARDWAETYGYDRTRVIEREEMAQLVASPAYVGGVLDMGGGHLHPLAYARGLARAAEQAGARIFENSPVVELLPGRGARTAKGRIKAEHLVLCGNAFVPSIAPDLGRYVMPVASSVAVTAPLPENVLPLIRDRLAVSDSRHIVDYYRMTPDGRLLFGGGASYWIGGSRDPARLVAGRIRAVFPQIAGIRLDWAWTGHVAITSDRMPYFGRRDGNLWFAHGFSGHGVCLTGLAGKLIAQAIMGEAENFERFAKLRHLPFPGGPLRAPLLAAAMSLYRLRDML
ncbi:FAD-binding oxidoreductase [Telmatospirillum sp. J64-1]|uniref:NAD(P)/FAD-dependent oxidoreductase n=1 Tax=Telmatospirillum sp. J64-1 TaxID=2502183 RepID=UPI00115DB75F|nr:FAD-binding oxidoreductase [Telmatospirillum sp. J64-1]